MQYELLVVLNQHLIHFLHIELGAERNGGKSLGFTTVKMALPCTQGRTSVSHQIGRTSVEVRPSRRRPSSRIRLRMASFSTAA